MKAFLNNKYVVVIILLLVSGGCRVVGPDYTRPEIKVPNQWPSGESLDGQEESASSRISTEALAEWWTTLDDPMLTSLVERALSNNQDLRIALTRIRQARASLGFTEKQRDPSVTGSAQYRRTQSGTPNSENDDPFLFTSGSDFYDIGFDAGWEMDLFGKKYRNIEAAVAELHSSEEAYRGVMVSLVSETVSNYVRLRTFQQQQEIVFRNLALQEKALDVLESQVKAGLISSLQVQQSRYNIENTKSRIPGYRINIEATLNTLAILLGEMPGSLHQELENPEPVPVPDVEIAIGIPADILRRRPDIRIAERELAAQTARIGAATAELYPSFRLSGSLGMTAGSLNGFFSDDSPGISITPFISLPLFNRDKIRDQIEVQNAIHERYLIEYETSVLDAIKEVRDAVMSYGEEQKRYLTLEKGAAGARTALDIASEQYRSGLVTFINVLDAQRALLSFEETQVSSKGLITQDLIRLYKSLGGGWNPAQP
jgi:NodT family efflux transporter outer membrane factor (OMF) lipoprotein